MAYADDEFPVNLDTGGDAPNTITGILGGAAAPSTPQGTSLSLLMDPHDIASVGGLPSYAYGGNGALGDYAAQRMQQDVGGQQVAGDYAPAFDQVSLAPADIGSDTPLPDRIDRPQADQNLRNKIGTAADGLGYLGHGIDWWNAQNAMIGIHLGQEGAKILSKYTDPVAKVLGPLGDGVEGYSEWRDGAPAVPTAIGAATKTMTGWAGAKIGALGGAEIGSLFGQPEVGAAIGGAIGGFAPEVAYRHMSQEQIGKAVQKLPGLAAASYPTYVYNNPYYDPRTAMP